MNESSAPHTLARIYLRLRLRDKEQGWARVCCLSHKVIKGKAPCCLMIKSKSVLIKSKGVLIIDKEQGCVDKEQGCVDKEQGCVN